MRKSMFTMLAFKGLVLILAGLIVTATLSSCAAPRDLTPAERQAQTERRLTAANEFLAALGIFMQGEYGTEPELVASARAVVDSALQSLAAGDPISPATILEAFDMAQSVVIETVLGDPDLDPEVRSDWTRRLTLARLAVGAIANRAAMDTVE